MDRLGGFFGSRDAADHLDDDFVEDDDADLGPPPSPVGQDERRMQVRAYNHWASLLGDRNFPDIEDLEPERLDDFGPHSVLLDFTAGFEDPRVAYIGAELAEECGHSGRIGHLSDVPSRSVLSRITDHYMQILANQAPIGFEAEFVNERSATVLYRGILLPYSSDEQTIDYIYGVINWKEMADQQTADALLLEIDQALADPFAEGAEDAAEPVATAEMLARETWAASEDGVLELGSGEMMDSVSSDRLPQPAFGRNEGAGETPRSPNEAGSSPPSRPDRSVDALGNPIGGQGPFAGDEPDEDDFDSGIKTAADYGLPDWDDEDEEQDDVDGVVDPLADEETSSSLIALVSRGNRAKKSVDLSLIDPTAPVPTAYEPAAQAPRVPQAYEGHSGPAEDSGNAEASPRLSGRPADSHGEAATPGTPPADGLYDCLALAREMAHAAQNTEDRSRKALYDAVGRAYDFSLEAQSHPDDYHDLLADNDLTVHDRAPMTPIVKLVFGADYDKTRLTEYAAVLMHAHRVGVERGSLAGFLREAEGGLKGVVQAERRARKEEQGKPLDDDKSVRPALARKLRKLEPVTLAELGSDGPEFALAMLRRTPEGAIEIIGRIPEDVALVEKAARKLLG